MTLLIISILTVLIISALCSGTEAALFSITDIQLMSLENNSTKSNIIKIKNDLDKYIPSIVILNNVANIIGSIVIGSLASSVLGNNLLGIFSSILTLCVIIFSEIIPKTLGERHALKVSCALSSSVILISVILKPVLYLIKIVVTPIVGENTNTYSIGELELKNITEKSKEEGTIDPHESEMIHNVFSLDTITGKCIMTPRTAITRVKGSNTLEESRDLILASQHSRIIVIGETIDDIIGVLYKVEYLTALLNPQTYDTINSITKNILYVDENITAHNLLKMFQKDRIHIAIVRDEFGGVSGVVTLEDVLEIISGEIVDETDEVEDLRIQSILC